MAEENGIDAPDASPGFRERTLKAAGYSYIVGDLSMMAAGVARGKDASHVVRSGAMWFLGGLFAAIWGNPDHEQQLRIQAKKLEKHVMQKGVSIPEDARERSALLKKPSFLGHVSEFLYEHPSEMLNSMYAIGAAMMLHGSLKPASRAKGFTPKSADWKGLTSMNNDFWIGAIVLAGAGTGLLVKEDPDALKKAEGKGPLQKLYAHIAVKPLGVTSVLYGINNIFLAARLGEDYHHRNSEKGASGTGYKNQSFKPHFASTLQLATYLFSNTMLFLSHRNQITAKGFTPREVAQLENAAAYILAGQPKEYQKALLDDVANYISKEKGITRSAPEIAQALRHRLEQIAPSQPQPEHVAHSWALREAARQSEPAMPAVRQP